MSGFSRSCPGEGTATRVVVAIACERVVRKKAILMTNVVCVAAGRVSNGEELNKMSLAAKGN